MVRISDNGPSWKQGVNAFRRLTILQKQFIIIIIKTWKPGFLKSVETKSFHVFLKIFQLTKKKKKISSHVFVGIAMEEKHAKIQRKPRNCTGLEL